MSVMRVTMGMLPFPIRMLAGHVLVLVQITILPYLVMECCPMTLPCMSVNVNPTMLVIDASSVDLDTMENLKIKMDFASLVLVMEILMSVTRMLVTGIVGSVRSACTTPQGLTVSGVMTGTMGML